MTRSNPLRGKLIGPHSQRHFGGPHHEAPSLRLDAAGEGASALQGELFVAVLILLVLHLLVGDVGRVRRQQRRRPSATLRRQRAVVHGATLGFDNPDVGAQEADEANHAEDVAGTLQSEEARAEDDDEGGEPVDHPARTERRPPDLHRVDLGEVKPRHRAQAETEGHDKDGEADDCRGTRGTWRHHRLGPGVDEEGDENHRHGLAKGPKQQQLAAAPMVDQPGAEDGRQNVRAGHQSRGQGQEGRLDASICEQTV
mmetsp:Transcript_85821/g.218782  ORF Transcript_85821/g.218782 Transcript_85821/m.218782 type:complete len:255 (-) Transcript_85821:302-1066(-)